MGEDEKQRIKKLLEGLGRVQVKDNGVHKFWDTQPVPKLDDAEVETLVCGTSIEPDVAIDQVRAEPYPLLSSFEWVEYDVSNPNEMDEVYTLLYENYVEDGDAFFRFDYSREFLLWALKPPGYRKDWHLGVRVKATNKLVAFITAIPASVQVRESEKRMVEINFLCVHKKLRSKRLAPVLIKEITRRVNRTGIFQALYTAGVLLPRPVVSCQYWHRSLNPKKLIAVGFSRLAPRMTLSRTIRLFSLPQQPSTPGLRPLESKDCQKALVLVNDYLSQFALRVHFSEEEFAHWFMPRKNVIYSYVVENPDTNELTDFTSFYSLPSSVIRHEKYKTLNAAYSYYTVAKSVTLAALTKDALILARNNDFDVFNALNLMHNNDFLQTLRFNPGDGILNYYIFNWKTRPLQPEENGLVLL